MSQDPLDQIMDICHYAPPDALSKIADIVCGDEPAVHTQGEPVAEMVYFHYQKSTTECSMPVPLGSADFHVLKELQHSVIPLCKCSHPITSDRREDIDTLALIAASKIILLIDEREPHVGFTQFKAKIQCAIIEALTTPNDQRESGDAQRAFPQSDAHVCKFERAMDLSTLDGWYECSCGKKQSRGMRYFKPKKSNAQEITGDNFWHKDLAEVEGSFLGGNKITDLPIMNGVGGIPDKA